MEEFSDFSFQISGFRFGIWDLKLPTAFCLPPTLRQQSHAPYSIETVFDIMCPVPGSAVEAPFVAGEGMDELLNLGQVKFLIAAEVLQRQQSGEGAEQVGDGYSGVGP